MLIPAFKVGWLTYLVAVFESHCCFFAGMGNLQRRDYCRFDEAMEFFYWLTGFFLWQPQLDGTNNFTHGKGSRMVTVKIFMIWLREFCSNSFFLFIYWLGVFLVVARTGKMSQWSPKCPCKIGQIYQQFLNYKIFLDFF